MKIFFITFCFVSFSLLSNAQWTSNSVLNTLVATSDSAQLHPNIISDGLGGVIIAWVENKIGGTSLLVQRLDASGIKLWGNSGVLVCSSLSFSESFDIISDSAGGVIISWSDMRNSTSQPQIYSQRISSAGIPLWIINGVLISHIYVSASPQVISDRLGGAIITWYDSRNSTTGTDIYAQRINSMGSLQWLTDVVVCNDSNSQISPSIAEDGLGGAIISWVNRKNNFSDSDIYAQHINSAGVIQWNVNGISICNNSYFQNNCKIISDGSNGAIIYWLDQRNPIDHNNDIYAQRVSATGLVQWAINGVAICSELDEQYDVAAVSDGMGGAIFSWTDNRGGGFPDLYSQRINSIGLTQWANNGLFLFNLGLSSSILSDGLGGAIITWAGITNIYAEHLLATGTKLWNSMIISNSNIPSSKITPKIMTNQIGGAIITWEDQRNGYKQEGVFAQNVCSDGLLGMCLSNDISILSSNIASVVYPNPSNGQFTIRENASATYNIINEFGQVIKKINLTEQNNYTTIIMDINAGVYYLVPIDNDKFICQKIIIIN